MNEKLRHLDLFSGIGGFALGLESTGGFETVGFCDNEPFAQKVLKKHWPDVPCYEDVRNVGVDTVGYRGVDIITGGFPCQPFSVAGKQDPKDNRQLWPEMFRIIKEIRPTYVIGENVRNLISIREVVVFEQVCTDLEGEGYEVQTFVLPASAVNAPHQRYRCWIVGIMADSKCNEHREEIRGRSEEEKKIQRKQGKEDSTTRQSGRAGAVWETSNRHGYVADTRCEHGEQRNATEMDEKQTKRSSRTIYDKSGSERQSENVSDTNNTGDRTSRGRTDENRENEVKGWKEQPQSKPSRHSKDVAYSCGSRRKVGIPEKGYRQEGNAEEPDNNSNRLSGWQGKDNWTVEPSVGRVAHGIPNRVDRLKGLGNAVVPQIPAVLGRAILEVHNS